MGRLKGRIAAVTGAASGIGRAIADRFVREGAHVAILDINKPRAAQAADEINRANDIFPGGDAISVPCDVTSAESIENAVKYINRTWGVISILVNSAGYSRIATLENTTEDLWDRTLSINLKSMFLTCKAVVPFMADQSWGRVINMSSQSGKRGASSYSAYCASKFGIIGLTQSLAQEYAETGVTVNAICPGIVFTELWNEEHIAAYGEKRGIPADEVKGYLVDKIPMKRAASVEDIAGVAAFLASDDASYLTGQSYNVTGGSMMH